MRNILAASMVLFLSIFPSAGIDGPSIHAPTAIQIAERIDAVRDGAIGWRELPSMALWGKIDLSDFLIKAFNKSNPTSCSNASCVLGVAEEPKSGERVSSPVVELLPIGPELHSSQGHSSIWMLPAVCSLEVTTPTTTTATATELAKIPRPTPKEHTVAPQSIQKEHAAASPQQVPAMTPVSLPLTPPLSPEPVEPKALRVSCQGDQLTIIADNSTLSEILAEVSAQTRAEIEIPAGASSEKLSVVRLGPGPAREVLTSLLSWTTFDYVIQASDADPLGIKSVFLVARTKTPTGGPAGTALASGRQPPTSQPRKSAEPNLSSAESGAAENPVPLQPAAPAEVPPSQHQVATAAQDSNSNQSQSKSTQEMIDELQRMYQQRRQIQQPQPGQKPRTGV